MTSPTTTRIAIPAIRALYDKALLIALHTLISQIGEGQDVAQHLEIVFLVPGAERRFRVRVP